MRILDTSGQLLIEVPGSLVGADLAAAHLRRAVFTGLPMAGVCFDDAILEDAELSGCDLYWARCFRAQMSRANLENATLRGADLKHAKLCGANLRHADLSDDNVGGHTSIQGTDFSDADFTGIHLAGARYSRETRLPSGFDPIEAGAVEDPDY